MVTKTSVSQSTSQYCDTFNLYGPYYSSDLVRISDGGGIAASFYAFTIYLGIQTMDSSSPSSGYWQQATQFTILFWNSSGNVQTNSY